MDYCPIGQLQPPFDKSQQMDYCPIGQLQPPFEKSQQMDYCPIGQLQPPFEQGRHTSRFLSENEGGRMGIEALD
jgi:hypothetical protein